MDEEEKAVAVGGGGSGDWDREVSPPDGKTLSKSQLGSRCRVEELACKGSAPPKSKNSSRTSALVVAFETPNSSAVSPRKSKLESPKLPGRWEAASTDDAALNSRSKLTRKSRLFSLNALLLLLLLLLLLKRPMSPESIPGTAKPKP